MSDFLQAILKRDTDGTQPRDELGRWTDTGQYVGDVPIGGVYHPHIPSFDDEAWLSQAEQHPQKGPPGISYVKNKVGKHTVDTLLYRNKSGTLLLGILYHYPKEVPGYQGKGSINVLVDPLNRRQGIGSQLLREAGKRWNINLWAQDYTPEGAALARAVTHPDLKRKPRYDKDGWLIPAKVKVKKSWLGVVKDYVWNEAYHARGKTTPESNSGSFAPMLKGPQSLTIESYEYKRPGVRHQTKIDVIFNPDRTELKRWAGRDVKITRWLQWGDNVVVWNSYDALHQQVANALVKAKKAKSKDFEDAYWNGNNFDNGPNVRTGDTSVSDMLTNFYNDVVPVKKSWLGTITESLFKWNEEDHPRGKTTEASRGGSFAPKGVLDWPDGEIRTIHAVTRTTIIKNPTPEQFARFAGREIKDTRYMDVTLADGKVDRYVWDDQEAMHSWVARYFREHGMKIVGPTRDGYGHNPRHPERAHLHGAQQYTYSNEGWVDKSADGSRDDLKKSWLQVLKDAAGWKEEDHPRGETTEGTNKGSFRPRNMGFVSPNIDENVDFQEAASRVQSHRTKLLLQADEEIAELYGTHTYETVGVGAWADGAEQSIIVDGSGDFEAFKAHMALSGLLAEQKAVIAFTNDAKGPDSVYRLSVGNRPLREVHAALLEAGVQFHTLRKTDHNVDVFVFAPGTEQELQDAVAKAAERFGVDEVDFVRGYGEFIGSWDSREEGRKAYEALLDGYEGKVPRHDGGWKALRDRWLPRLQAVRKSWLESVISWEGAGEAPADRSYG